MHLKSAKFKDAFVDNITDVLDMRFSHLIDIPDPRIASLHFTVLVKSLHHLPPPVSILLLLGEPPHQEVGLHSFRAQDIVPEEQYQINEIQVFEYKVITVIYCYLTLEVKIW